MKFEDGRIIKGEVNFQKRTEKKGMLSMFKNYIKEMWSYNEFPKDFFELIITEGNKELLKGRGS